jgi:glycosyltransferase involved in cell wall biosynthesis
MKILTNIRFHKLAGIAQTLSSLSSYVKKQENSKKLELIGVEMAKADNSGTMRIEESRENNFRVITASMPHPNIKELVKESENVGKVQKELTPIINQYKEIIRREKPDAILLNGTYYLPWCLLLAARNTVKNIILHYHGSLTKETEHYPEAMRRIFRDIEKTFDSDNLRYIFPSLFAKDAVAKDVFGREPKHFCILPNSIPLHFFEAIKRKNSAKNNIGMVARWRHVKNKSFIKKYALHNSRSIKSKIFNLLSDFNVIAGNSKHIRGSVKMVQPMENAKMARFYSKMDIVVCPSHFETYGNVAQEAIACGTPALISPNMGVAEQFRRFGLDKWISPFDVPSRVFKKIDQMMEETVDQKLRLELKNELNPDRIHGLLLSYVKSNKS